MKKTLATALSLALLLAVFSLPVRADIYRYRDREGRLFYVDDPGKIPEECRGEATAQKELKSDPRPPAKPAEPSPAPEVKDAEPAPGRFPPTKVIISDNQVLVPAQVCFRGNRVQVVLLLDTGAQATALDASVAERLRIVNPPLVPVQGVGGAVMAAGLVTLDYIKVGPHLKKNVQALVLPQSLSAPYRGLLGMSFLSGLHYSVDFKKKMILWAE